MLQPRTQIQVLPLKDSIDPSVDFILSYTQKLNLSENQRENLKNSFCILMNLIIENNQSQRRIEPLKVECQEFLSCINNGFRPTSCGVQGLQVTRVLETSSESLKIGGATIELEKPIFAT